jgi:hypothetical protein
MRPIPNLQQSLQKLLQRPKNLTKIHEQTLQARLQKIDQFLQTLQKGQFQGHIQIMQKEQENRVQNGQEIGQNHERFDHYRSQTVSKA